MVASGYYFSELSGQISQGTLTLKGIYDVGNQSNQSAYVNIMTHLINNRVIALLGQGLTATNAIAQAQRELVDAFSSALPTSDPGKFSSLSVYNVAGTNDAGNAYLLALSSGFYKLALTVSQQFGTTPEGELTLVLNRISDDFADDGVLQTAGFMDDFVRALRSVTPAEIAENLRRRSIVDYPAGLDVPAITRFLNQCTGALDCTWRAGAGMSYPSAGHAVAGFGGKVYVFGGRTPLDQYSDPEGGRASRVYEPIANRWTELRPMSVGGVDLKAQVVGNKIYVIAGYGIDDYRNNLLEYDPSTDMWGNRAPNPTYRSGFVSEAVNGRIYVIGGRGTIHDGPRGGESGVTLTYKDRVSIYDVATNIWSQGQSAPMALGYSASCALGNKIYVFGGLTDSGAQAVTLVYDTITNSWSTKAPPSVAKSQHACERVGDQFYVFGGYSGGAAQDAVDRYDPANDTWTSIAQLPSPHFGIDAAAVGGEIVIPGGMGLSSGMYGGAGVIIFNPMQ
ncbi:Kelch repeat-containing protein [Steroidobacter cummioxidans]|uniref:Kelch repeat-containing protein n=1 Tax=Steroidobacter cummioxidans TaxID=1803913 RepID=UPI001F4DD1D2|nr:kelch repeat-containing protein [Steroidobacter cummioxidans]